MTYYDSPLNRDCIASNPCATKTPQLSRNSQTGSSPHLPLPFTLPPASLQIRPPEPRSAHPMYQSTSRYVRAPSGLHYSHSPTTPWPYQLCGQPSYHRLNRPPAAFIKPYALRLGSVRHTMIKPSPPSSSSHALAICRIPAGSGLGGLNSRVTIGANVLPGRKVCSKCVTGPLDSILSKQCK